MIDINSTTKCIFLTRGDDATINVKLASGSFTSGDSVVFTARPSVEWKDVALQKTVTTFKADGSADIVLTHNDTKDLAFGTYIYDVQRIRSGVYQTIIAAQTPDGKMRTFTLGAEVGY